MLWCSQVAPGCQNGLRLRVYGDTGGLSWAQEDPDVLWVTHHGEATRRIVRGGPGAGDAAAAVSRVPAGHPEGYLEGFATLYSEAAGAIRAVQSGIPAADAMGDLPGIAAGLEGMAFIRACVASAGRNAAWVKV